MFLEIGISSTADHENLGDFYNLKMEFVLKSSALHSLSKYEPFNGCFSKDSENDRGPVRSPQDSAGLNTMVY